MPNDCPQLHPTELRVARRAWSLLILAGLLGCEPQPVEATAPGDRKTGSSTPFAEHALWLTEPTATSTRSGALWLPLRRGDGTLGDVVVDLGATRFDSVPFRIGGEQRQLTVAQQGDGARGLRVVAGDARGSSLVGFTTEPEVLRDTPNSKEILLQQHAKLCLHVPAGAWERPEPSPALAARFGWRLEIVPMMDPLPQPSGERLLFRVRFDGPGLEGCDVVCWLHADGVRDAVEVFRGKSGRQGIFEVPLHRHGLWRIAARHRVAGEADRRDELHLASLVFRSGGGR